MSNAAAVSAADDPAVGPSQRRRPSRSWIVLSLILLLAGLVRWHNIGQAPYWQDELCTLQAISGRGLLNGDLPRDTFLDPAPDITRVSDSNLIWSIWTNMDRDVHPPLYFLFARLWRDLFGTSELAMRSLSLLFSLAAIVVLFLVSRHHIGDAGALCAAALMALAQQQIYYAREARGYTLELLIGLLACLALLKIESHGATLRRLVALGLCALGMLVTHYFSLGAFVALGLYALIRLRGRERLLVLLTLALAGLAFAVLWGPFLLQQQRHAMFAANTWLHADAGLKNVLSFAAALPLAFLADPGRNSLAVTGMASVLYMLPLLLLKRRPGLLLWSLWLICTVGFIAGMDLARGILEIAYARFTLLAAPAMFVLLVACAQSISRPLGILVLLSSLLLCAVSVPRAYERSFENWRELGQFLQKNVRPGDTIAILAGDRDRWYGGTILEGIRHYSDPLAPMVLMTQPARPDFLLRIQNNPGHSVWIVEGDCAKSLIPAYFPPGYQVDSARLLLDIGRLYRITYRPTSSR